MKIFIAGGTGGLGSAMVEAFTHSGEQITPTSRAVRAGYRQADWKRDNPRQVWPDANEYDALIINAGLGHDGVFAVQPDSEIEDMLAVNLLGALRLTKWYVRQRLQKGGIVLYVSSVAGLIGMKGLVAYSATKAGLIGSVRALAREVGPAGFRINAICPGFIETDMTAQLSQAKRISVAKRTPLGRLATVQDIIPVIQFLVSPSAQWITGQAIAVDGGFSC